ncbi:AlwI family type II restriction endonuclease, partial [Clostridium sp. AM58-1XD]|uniref:AlwI family type II restriction endonuclease n=1 Tax=Clostridium sp. AM58-1XD TaxID=2292307 RepID=UPI000E52E687
MKRKNKSKDARETTSGLVDIGLISDERLLTEVGKVLLAISKSGSFAPDNVLQLPKDSYVYFKQLLKTSCSMDGKNVRPFLVLSYLLDRLGNLTFDEYTYLLPLCIDKETTLKIAEYIAGSRSGDGRLTDTAGIDDMILRVLMSMDNYRKAEALFLENEVDRELLRTVGMNRKSRSYDDAYEPLYRKLYEVCFEGKMKSAGELYKSTTSFQNKIGGQWRRLLFDTTSAKAIEKDPARHVKRNGFQEAADEREFKYLFFRTMHLFKAKSTLSDYQDLNKRYIKNSDTVLFEDGMVKFDIVPKHFFRGRMSRLFSPAFEKAAVVSLN